MNREVQICFIRPGRPVENGFAESVNRQLRDECLNVSWFSSMADASRKLGTWRSHYNEQRPYSALDDRAPAVFAKLQPHRATRLALRTVSTASATPPQGFAPPAKAALDPDRHLPQDIYYEGEALKRIAQTSDSLLSIWSDYKARKQGTGGP